MKYTCQSRRLPALLCIATLMTAFTGIASFANPYNDGTTNSISASTNFNETLYVGIQNPNNTLLITSNSTVSATDVFIGQLTASSNNTVSVAGDALLLIGDATTNGIATGGVVVGSADGGVGLSINNSSTLNTEYLYVGSDTNGNGQIELSGNGTELNVAQDAYVGDTASTNSIAISGGATLSVGGVLTVGSSTTSNNHVSVASGGNLYVNSTNDINVVNATDGDNGISISGGGTLQVGSDVNTGTLDGLGVDMAKKSNLELGGTLKIDKNKIDNSLNVILNNDLSTNTATWSSGSLTVIGSTTSENSLTFTNGATGHALNIVQIGQQTTAARNKLNVVGSNSLFTADSDVFVGAQGDDNELNVSDGGQVGIAGNMYMGGAINASGNQVNISSNGGLNVEGDIIVGDNSNNNKFNLENGTVGVTNNFIMGNTANADGITYVNLGNTANRAFVGSNSTMNIHQDLTVGMGGNGNTFSILDGGVVNLDGDAIIGQSSDDNYIFLMEEGGTNNLFNVAGDLIVGQEGGDNRFSIYGGTANIGGNVELGVSTNQYAANYIHLATTNSILNVANAVVVGDSNSGNFVRVASGATINTHDLFVGASDGVSNNTVTISGEDYGEISKNQYGWLDYVADSFVYVTNTLEIGNTNGANNSVVVRNGGFLNVTQTNIIVHGEENKLNIANGGTLQTTDWDASIKNDGIVMDSGSTLELGGAYTGTSQLDNPYELVLNGSLSTNSAQWDTGSDILYVGYAASDNTLTAKDGGLVTTTTNLVVGRSAKTIRNTLASTGSGSLIDVGNNLIVGNTGSSKNELVVEDAGQVHVGNNLIIGSRSSQNTTTVTGSTNGTSLVNIEKLLIIGSGTDATGNVLEIASNATVNVYGIATIGSGTDNNTLKLTGTNALLNAYSNLVVGAGTATGNKLSVLEGTAIIMGDLAIGQNKDGSKNGVTVSGSNSTLQVLSNLYVGKDGHNNTLDISDGGMVNVQDLYLGFTTNSHDNALTVAGTNSSLAVAGTLYAGYKGGKGSLKVSDGATLEAADAYIGYDSINNQVEVYGSNSMLNVLNNLWIGTTNSNVTDDNALWVYDDATASIGGDLSLSHGVLYIKAGSQVTVGGNYNQDGDSTLALRVSTNDTPTHLTVGNTASFAKDTRLELLDDNTVVGTTNNFSRALVAAGDIKIDNQTATQDLLNDDINIANDLLKFNLILSNNIIWLDNVTRLSLATQSGLEPGSQLAYIADEVDSLADSSNAVAVAMRNFMDTELDSSGRNAAFDNYYGEKMSSTPAHNAINIGMQSVAEQLTKRADSTRARMGMASADAPAGAGGPHTEDQELQGWMTGFKTWADKKASDGFDAYNGDISGFLIGGDMTVANGILVGLAGGAGQSSLDKDNGATADTDSKYGSIYASVGTKDWFADASLIVGGSSIDSTLGSTFDTKSSYNAKNTAIYIGGGKEIIGNYLIFTPQASLLANYYKQDGYTEKGTNALVRSVSSFDTLYFQSSLGCNVAFYSTIGDMLLKPEFRAFWMHEFNANDENVPFQLVGGTGSYNLQLQAPESDIFKLGAGVSAKIGEYLELRADLDARYGGNYSDHTLLGSIRYQF